MEEPAKKKKDKPKVDLSGADKEALLEAVLYIEDKLQEYSVNFTRIAQGVPTGVSLENIDILSLTRALEDRVKI